MTYAMIYLVFASNLMSCRLWRKKLGHREFKKLVRSYVIMSRLEFRIE